ANLQPTCAAAVGLTTEDGRQWGTLVACSQDRRTDMLDFESLERFADIIAARFRRLQPNRLMPPEFRKDNLWNRLRDRMLQLDVYRSSGCLIPWRYRIFDDAWGLLTFGIHEDDAFVGQLQAERRGSSVPA